MGVHYLQRCGTIVFEIPLRKQTPEPDGLLLCIEALTKLEPGDVCEIFALLQESLCMVHMSMSVNEQEWKLHEERLHHDFS